jgi:hypothetical protein
MSQHDGGELGCWPDAVLEDQAGEALRYVHQQLRGARAGTKQRAGANTIARRGDHQQAGVNGVTHAIQGGPRAQRNARAVT